jgi:dGTPase
VRNISQKELTQRYIATAGVLAHLRHPDIAIRRYDYGDEDIQRLDNPFVRDLGAIEDSKAWRRLSGKNQVASTCDDVMPHLRDRQVHVSEVRAKTRRIADHLGVNVLLADAIAAVHDIGHVPLGHQGEEYLRQKTGKDITHEKLGVVVMQHIERKGRGANLSHVVLYCAYSIRAQKNLSNSWTGLALASVIVL